MKIEKKLAVIGAISLMVSVVFFYLSDVEIKSRGFMGSLLDIFIASALIFIVLAINFFVLSFIFKKVRTRV